MKHLIPVPKKSLVSIGLVVLLILLVPLVATFMNPNALLNGGSGGGVDWGLVDFAIMGALLYATGFMIEIARRNLTNPTHRFVACAVILLGLLAVWVELAVDGVTQFLHFLFREFGILQ